MTRVLVVAPHPDDEALGCGGTVRRHVLDGDDVRVVFVTSGEGGGHGADPTTVGALREAEARAAAEVLGLCSDAVDFWRQRDGALRATGVLAERLAEEVDRHRSDLVYAPYLRDMHPDHRATARAVRVALSGREQPLVLMYETWTPLPGMDRIVDISETLDDKLAALRAHASQCAVVGFVAAAEGLARYRGELHSWPGGPYAEAFQRMST